MASTEGKKASMKSLAKQAKAIETKIKVLTDASKGSTRRCDIVAAHLSQNEVWVLKKHEELKEERKAAAGTATEESAYDSDENANRGGHKRSAFRATNDAIIKMQQSMQTPAAPTDLERALTEFVQRKLQKAEPVPTGNPADSIKARLDTLRALLDSGDITEDEHTAKRKDIIASL